MNIYDIISNRRTVRIFEKKEIPEDVLKKFVNAARLAPSARNLQPLEYLVVDDETLCEKVFNNVYFGGGVEKLQTRENRPRAYILVLVNKKIRSKNFEHDAGLAVENIALEAYGQGIGVCIMGAIERPALTKIFNLPSHYYLDLVLALGYPAIEEGYKEYWRNGNNVLHVPKRTLKEILHWNGLKN